MEQEEGAEQTDATEMKKPQLQWKPVKPFYALHAIAKVSQVI